MYVTEADGRRVRRQVYGRTRSEAETRLVELRSKAESGAPMTPAHLTVEAFLKEWLAQIVGQRVRPNTLAAYTMYVERYLVPDLGKRRLGTLTAREVRRYLDGLQRRGVGVRSVRYVHATLRAALQDAMREELLEKNVAKLVRPPSEVRAERHPLTLEQIGSFLKSTRDDRLHAMFVVMTLLGLRRSEVLGLRWDDVDLVEGTLQVRRGLHRLDGSLRVMETKTVRSRRTIPLPAPVLSSLRAHLLAQERERADLGKRWPESGFVFTTTIGTPIDPDNCSKLVRAAMKRAVSVW